jgi:hypothetical protein
MRQFKDLYLTATQNRGSFKDERPPPGGWKFEYDYRDEIEIHWWWRPPTQDGECWVPSGKAQFEAHGTQKVKKDAITAPRASNPAAPASASTIKKLNELKKMKNEATKAPSPPEAKRSTQLIPGMTITLTTSNKYCSVKSCSEVNKPASADKKYQFRVVDAGNDYIALKADGNKCGGVTCTASDIPKDDATKSYRVKTVRDSKGLMRFFLKNNKFCKGDASGLTCEETKATADFEATCIDNCQPSQTKPAKAGGSQGNSQGASSAEGWLMFKTSSSKSDVPSPGMRVTLKVKGDVPVCSPRPSSSAASLWTSGSAGRDCTSDSAYVVIDAGSGYVAFASQNAAKEDVPSQSKMKLVKVSDGKVALQQVATGKYCVIKSGENILECKSEQINANDSFSWKCLAGCSGAGKSRRLGEEAGLGDGFPTVGAPGGAWLGPTRSI